MIEKKKAKSAALKAKSAASKAKSAASKAKSAEEKPKAAKAPSKRKKVNEDESLVRFIAECMLEKKGEGVLSLDLRQAKGASFDFFVICEASSAPQIRAIADEIDEKVYKEFRRDPLHTEGYANGEWVLLDYGNIIAHVFLSEVRQHYRLEELWGDAVLDFFKD